MKKLISLLAVTLAFVACKKNDDGGGGPPPAPQQPYPYQYGQQCPQGRCQFSPQSLIEGAEGVSADGSVQVTISIHANGQMMMNGDKAIHSYFGPGVIYGTLRVGAPVSTWGCEMMPGSYQLVTELPVQVGMATIQGGRIILRNQQTGASYYGILSNSQLYNVDGYGVRRDTPNNRIGLNMMVQGMRGESCGTISTF